MNKLYLLLTLLVVAISGNPALGLLGKETVFIGALGIFVVIWFLRPLKMAARDLMIFGLFAALVVVHMFDFGAIALAASLGFLVKLAIALLAARLIPDFTNKFISVMFSLAVLSLLFYVPVQLGIDLPELLGRIRVPLDNPGMVDIAIHNFHVPDQRTRNCGMFWEPGAFAGYLILALFFMIRNGQNEGVRSKRGVVLLAALLSTQSTTGYLALAVLSMLYIVNARWVRSLSAKAVVIPMFLAAFALIAWVSFSQLNFLGDKIGSQIDVVNSGDDRGRVNRIGNFLYDLKWIAEKPVFGWSATPETRLSDDAEVADLVVAQGNGLTGFAVKFGLLGLFSFLGFSAYCTRRITGSWLAAYFGTVILCVLLNGEQFLGFPVFLTLMFEWRPKFRELSRVHRSMVSKSAPAPDGPGY
jgi:hypothetical protein